MTYYKADGLVEVAQIPWSVINDRRLSAADLGVYVRFTYANQLYFDVDLELLVNEFKMPRAETEAALQRLVVLEHLYTKESPHPANVCANAGCGGSGRSSS